MRTRVGTIAAAVLVVLTALPASAVPDIDQGVLPAVAHEEDCDPPGEPNATCAILVTGRDGVTAELDIPRAALLGWFPDGYRLLVGRPAAGGQRLSAVDIRDGGEQPVADVPGASRPVLSPLGDRIAYLLSERQVAVADLRTGEVRTVAVRASSSFVRPAWSPDGARLAVPADLGTPTTGTPPTDQGSGNPGLVLVDVDAASTVEVPVAARPDPCDVGPTEDAVAVAWAPDGQRLALSTDLGNGSPCGYRTVVVALDGGLVRDVGDTSALVDDGAWSPDGAAFAFTIQGVGPAPSGTGYARADGTILGFVAGPQVLGSFPVGWSPDGRRHLAVARSEADDGAPVFTLTASDPTAAAGDPPTVEGTPVAELGQVSLSEISLAPGAVTRAAGLSRVDTAAAVSRSTWDSSTAVVVAPSASYAEPLAAAPLAGRENAPVLLTGADRLAPQAAAEITRLGATTAYLAGGGAVLSAQVATDLSALGLDVERLGGDGPFATAASVAAEVGGTAAYVVEGVDQDPARGWPDAVSASGLAALTEVPVLLVEDDRLPDETAAAIEELALESVTVIGGEDAVSDAVADEIAALGVTVDRVEGATRYGTSAAVAGLAEAAGAVPATTWVATGTDFPDSLTAGPAAAHEGAVLLLADRDQLSASAETAALLAPPRLQRVRLAGGSRALTHALELELERRIPWP